MFTNECVEEERISIMELGEKIGEGNTAEVYAEGEEKILKLYRKGMPKEACEKEYHCASVVAELLDKVPKVYEMIEIDDRFGIVYERINGISMLKQMMSAKGHLNQVAKRLAKCHREIQTTVNADLITLKDKLKQDLSYVEVFTSEEKAKIIAYLDQLPDGKTLCHMDFHPGNILLRGEEPVYIDWMTAAKGDGYADVARTCIMLSYTELPNCNWIVQNSYIMS